MPMLSFQPADFDQLRLSSKQESMLPSLEDGFIEVGKVS